MCPVTMQRCGKDPLAGVSTAESTTVLGTGKPAGARLDMQISLDGDITLEQHGAAVDGLHVAADRRWFCVRGDDKAGAFADVHVAGNRDEVKGAGRPFRNGDVTCDVGHCRTAA